MIVAECKGQFARHIQGTLVVLLDSTTAYVVSNQHVLKDVQPWEITKMYENVPHAQAHFPQYNLSYLSELGRRARLGVLE